MADAKSAVAFARAAVNFEVHESDFLVLCNDRVTTFEAMAKTDFRPARISRITSGAPAELGRGTVRVTGR